MRIGVDVRPLLEPQPSGVSEYTRNLLTHLFEIDNENQYILFANSFDRDKKIELPKKDNVEIKFFHYPNKIFNVLVNFLGYPKIDQLLGGVDVFLAPNLQFISLSDQCKKIVTVHDLSFEIYPQFLSRRRKLWHRIINPKKFIQSADQLIAVSQSTKQDLVDLYNIDEARIQIIHSGINQQPKEVEQGDLPEKYILSLSTFEPRKNIDSLILAFQKLIKKEQFKDYKLILAGAKGWKSERIYNLAKKDPRIRILGYVSDKEKASLLKHASVFVYPSFYEGFGFPPLEALAQDTPVIASAASSLPEILGDAALYVNPYNIFDILKALENLLSNSTLQEDLVMKGKEQVQKFSWEQTAKKTLAIF